MEYVQAYKDCIYTM